MLHKVAACPAGTLVPGHYVSPSRFARQMRLLKRLGFTTVGLDDLFFGELPKRPVVVTFDDGYRNFHQHALPVLKELGFQSTVFLVANLIGGQNEWDVRQGDVPEALMTLAEIREAREQGTQFGSHTLDHADLNAVSEAEAWRQIAESKEVLETQTGAPVFTFCYPYGRKSAQTEEFVRRAGYRCACSTIGGLNTPETDRFALRRVNVRKDTTPTILLYKLLRDLRRA